MVVRINQWLMMVLLSISMSSLAAAELSVHVDQSQVVEGETLQLMISTDDSDSEPDTRELEHDFHIAGTRRSSQVQIINGRMESTTQLVYTLSPKRSGQLQIPALEINGDISRPITITVSKTRPSQAGDDLFIETSADPKQPYVQSQVTYSVRIFQAIDIREAALPTPELADFMTRSLGEDVVYEAQRQGRRYRVTERRYALFPQRSGRLTIPAPRLNAKIATGRTQRGFDPFSLLRQSAYRPVNIVGNEINIDVRPKPSIAPTPWLPAQAVELTETWSDENTPRRVGEPITRTLTLQVRGLTGEQLPALTMAATQDFKVYTDQPQTSTDSQNVFVLGKRTEKIAIIPTRAGSLKLPAITLQWWDSANDRQQQVNLPVKVIEILPAVATTPKTAPTIPMTNDTATPVEQTNAERTTAGTSTSQWPLYLALALWLLTLAGWLWDRRHRTVHPSDTGTVETPQKNKDAVKRIKAACLTNQPEIIRVALLDWARVQWPNQTINTLGAVAERLANTNVANEIRQIDRRLYGGSDIMTDGSNLWRGLQEVLNQRDVSPDTVILAPLYPK